MGMQEAVSSVFHNYATFSGRARRAEYWWWVLFTIIVGGLLSLLDGMLFGYTTTTATGPGSYAFDVQTLGVLAPLWSLASFIPGWAVAVRRLHDTGRSGWWLLLFLIPLVGAIILLVWFATRGEPRSNAYGPDPIGIEG